MMYRHDSSMWNTLYAAQDVVSNATIITKVLYQATISSRKTRIQGTNYGSMKPLRFQGSVVPCHQILLPTVQRFNVLFHCRRNDKRNNKRYTFCFHWSGYSRNKTKCFNWSLISEYKTMCSAMIVFEFHAEGLFLSFSCEVFECMRATVWRGWIEKIYHSQWMIFYSCAAALLWDAFILSSFSANCFNLWWE